MANIPIRYQFFVERDRNNAFSWGMMSAMLALFALYGLIFNWSPRYLRRNQSRFPRAYRACSKVLRLWNRVNMTARLNVWPFGTFYIQTTVLLVLLIYILWLGLMCWGKTADLTYQPQTYIVGKRVGKVAVGNLPLLLLFTARNDVLTMVTGWPRHHITLLHVWMGRVIYLMMIVHVVLTTSYWLGLHYPVMIFIPPQIIGMIAFGSMSMLFLLSPALIRRLSYEFFLFNHGFFSFIMLLGGFLHNDGGKAPILVAVHAVAIDRVICGFRTLINWWCTKPVSSLAKYELVDSSTIRVTIPVCHKDFIVSSKKLATFGTWKPGQHLYLNVKDARWTQWHPFTIASVSRSRNIVLVLKVFKGFTRKLRTEITRKCLTEISDTCQLKTLYHGPYGATLLPLVDFDSVIFVAGGTGASFTFPLAIDLVQRITSSNSARCQRIRFIWYARYRENLDWYEPCITDLKESLKHPMSASVSIEVYITSTVTVFQDGQDVESNSSSSNLSVPSTPKVGLKTVKSSDCISTNGSILTVERGKPNVYELIEDEISARCESLGTEAQKDIAVLSCGPSSLVSEVGFEAERQERRHKNLTVYTYSEKYVI